MRRRRGRGMIDGRRAWLVGLLVSRFGYRVGVGEVALGWRWRGWGKCRWVCGLEGSGFIFGDGERGSVEA